MHKKFRSVLSLAIAFTLFITCFSGVASANQVEEFTEKEVDKLAEQLEFIYEEAVTKDENGNIIGVNIEKIEEEFGESEELEQLESTMQADSNNLSVSETGLITDVQSGLAPSASFSVAAARKIQPYPPPDAFDRCITNKIVKGYGEFFTTNTITTIINYMKKGNYRSAAHKLLSVGIKGNIAGTIATLIYYFGKCAVEVGTKKK